MASFIAKQVEPLSLLRKTLACIVTLFTAAVCFACYLIFTTPGTKLALRFIADFTPYQIEFEDLAGSLAHNLDIHRFQLKAPQFEMQAQELKVGWQLLDLLKKERRLQYLTAEKMHLKILSSEKISLKTESQSLSAVQSSLDQLIPMAIHIEDLHLQEAHIYWDNEQHYIKEFIVKNASNKLLEIAELHYQGSLGTAHADLRNGFKVDWDLEVNSLHPFFSKLLPKLTLRAFTSKGQIYLPSRQLDSPANKMHATLQTKEIIFSGYPIQAFSLQLQGNLASHVASFKGHYKNQPIDLNLLGKVVDKKWEGTIKKLEVKHPKWEKSQKVSGDILLAWRDAKTVSSTMSLLVGEYPIKLQANVEKKSPYPLTGQLQTQTNNLKLLSAFAPDLEHLEGKLNIDLKLAGTLLAPKWNGNFLLTGMKIRSSTLKSKAIIQSIRIAIADNQKINLTGQGTWGNGTFHLAGDGQLSESSPHLTVHFHGENLLLSDTPEYYIVANPDLTFSLKNGVPLLEGKIIVPKASIQPLKNPEMVMPSKDIVIVSAKQTKKTLLEKQQSLSSKLATNIEIVLGNSIFYKAFDLSAQVLGGVKIKQQPGQPPLGHGKLILKDGKYRAYGKTFDIAYGQLLFSGGPVYDPILDVQAQRQIRPHFSLATLHQNAQTITAGIKFTGSLKAPHIAFYSSPSMPDTDVISYLVVGRPQNQVNEAQAELLFQAVSQLASVMGKKRKDVNLDLAERLKLDQFGFAKKDSGLTASTANPLENTVFVLGKQLSDRLYLHYSVGILDSASNVGLRYLLGKNLMIEAATGNDGPSADILLSLEGH